MKVSCIYSILIYLLDSEFARIRYLTVYTIYAYLKIAIYYTYLLDRVYSIYNYTKVYISKRKK